MTTDTLFCAQIRRLIRSFPFLSPRSEPNQQQAAVQKTMADMTALQMTADASTLIAGADETLLGKVKVV